jgi:hypothetical protein
MLIFSPRSLTESQTQYSGIGAFQAIQAIPHFIYKSAVGQIRPFRNGAQVLGMGVPPDFHTTTALDVQQTNG